MGISLFHICLITIFASHLILVTSEKHVALYIFGDSYFDVGTNNYIKTAENFRANYFPYGESFFKHSTGRFSNGRVIPDFIGLPLLPAYLQHSNNKFSDGINFASGGAGALVETYHGLVVPLQMQLKQFKNVKKVLKHKLGERETKKLISGAVYLFHIGTNDYVSYFISNSTLFSSTSTQGYINLVIGNLTEVVKGIYHEGGRKFGIFGLGPNGCLPASRTVTGSCSHSLNELAMLHNKILHKILNNLQSHLNGFKYSIFDLYKSSLKIINHPSKYGFKEGKKACCGTGPNNGNISCGKTGLKYELCSNPNEYVFFDHAHPSEHTAQELSLLAWSGHRNVARPYNLQDLFHL